MSTPAVEFDRVAGLLLAVIETALRSRGDEVTPYALALAWNCGVRGSLTPTPGAEDNQSFLEPRIYRFTFEGEHPENALVHPPQRFFADESLQAFESEGELTQSE